MKTSRTTRSWAIPASASRSFGTAGGWRQGFIFIPYAAASAPREPRPRAATEIAKKLDPQTPDPQIIVQRVAGDGRPSPSRVRRVAQGVYPIERPTRTLSAMLARAGGVTIDPETAIVRVTRNGHTGKVWLLDLYENPASTSPCAPATGS
jgi:polysaccharide biosynthesis/export protein